MNQSLVENKFKRSATAVLFTVAVILFATTENRAQTSALTQQARIAAADGMQQNQFGFAVAISGDTAIVGAPRNGGTGAFNSNNGAAYIYVRNGTTWTFQQKITASDSVAGDQFGYSVAINGNIVAVGRLNQDIPTRSDGKVYIFTRAGTTWTQTQTLVSDDIILSDQFGSRLAMDGDTLVAGAYVKSNGGNYFQGAAYVFTRPSGGGNFTQQQKLVASDGSFTAYFGYAVAISGDTIVVGSPGAYKAYVFVRNGTSWTQQQFVQAGDGGTSGGFGNSVAVDGDTMIVSRYTDTIGGNPNAGSAYIYVRNGATWTQQQKINRTTPVANNGFGFAVAVKGNQAFAGVTNASVINVFTRTGTTWTQTQELINSPREAGLGQSLAVNGNSLVAGSYIDANGVNGSAFVYLISGTTANGRNFDFDGDGKADVSVFRPSNGTWYLQNSTSGFSGAQFGASGDRIIPADYDGDGKTDVAVYRNGIWYLQRSQLGFTSVSFGTAEDIPQPADYDGDGKADVAVFRPSNGTWYLNRSQLGFTGVQFGQTGDKPVAADYDGDGKTDVAVYRAGIWYLNRSQLGFTGISFGTTEDKATPADYDGDGKTDVAVFRPSNGTWYLSRSQLGFTGAAFGLGTDLPAPADYDGDGKADLAVFRSGTWYLQRSTAGFTGVSFGAGDDLPAPSAFVR